MRQFLPETCGAFIAHHVKRTPKATGMTSAAARRAEGLVAVGAPMLPHGKRGA
jgi:hypothetical protein